MASPSFTSAEVAEYRTLFDKADEDKSGSLCADEVYQLMTSIGEQVTKARATEIVKDIDVDGSGNIDFNEFLACLEAVRSGKKGASSTQFTGAVNKAATIYKVKGLANSEHSISEEERSAFAQHINRVLAEDPFLSQRLPMDPSTDELFTQCSDGIIFAKLVNLVEPGTVDERALNQKAKLTKFQIVENCNLAINAAKSIGCRITNIGAMDLMECRPHLILGIAWQIIRASLLSKISLKDCPELFRLLKEGESIEDLQKLPPEQLLLRWVNFHLEQSGVSRRLQNFGKDLADSEVYNLLLHQLEPTRCPLISETDPLQRATRVVQNASLIGVDAFLKPTDIVNGNSKLNLALIAQLFNAKPGLEELTVDDMNELGDQLAQLDLDDAGDTREERTFRMWINSLDIDGLYINELFTDLSDGIAILKVMDRIRQGCVAWKKVHMKPRGRIHVVDNCNTVVNVGRALELVLVNIGGTDIVDKNKKLILAIMWQLMRMFTLDMLASLSGDGQKITDKQVVAWANSKVSQGGRSTASIRSLQDSSLSTGKFLIELCSAVSPNTVDWSLVTEALSEEEKLNNARYAISIARKIGACVFLTPEDIVEVKPKMLFTFMGSLWATELSVGPKASPASISPKPAKIASPPPARSSPDAPARPSAPAAAAEAQSPPKPVAPPPVPPRRFSAPKPLREPPSIPQKPAVATNTVAPTPPPIPPKPSPSAYKSVNGTGEQGGMYGAQGQSQDVAEDEWDEED